MRYLVDHVTTYTYDDDVHDSLGIAYVVPRELPWQHVLRHQVDITPAASDVSTDTDWYGNTATYFQVEEHHRTLRVTATSEVEVTAPSHDEDALLVPWERARPADRPDVDDAWRVHELTFASPAVTVDAVVRDYAAASFMSDRPLAEAVDELGHRIHADFTYRPGVTTVTSSVDDVMRARAGVCQDFAHLAVAALRSHGLAACYVSGYLATDPTPGHDRLVGADATHAWVAVWVPGDGWLELDPTNDQRVDDRYVTVARGRDYADVPPLKGVIVTDATESTLQVAVDVVTVDA